MSGDNTSKLLPCERTKEQWEAVKPQTVVEGSAAQARNVLAMAIQDIVRLNLQLDAARAGKDSGAKPVAWQYRYKMLKGKMSEWIGVSRDEFCILDQIMAAPFEKRQLYDHSAANEAKIEALVKALEKIANMPIAPSWCADASMRAVARTALQAATGERDEVARKERGAP